MIRILEKINTFLVSLKFSYKEEMSQINLLDNLPQPFIYRGFKIIFYISVFSEMGVPFLIYITDNQLLRKIQF